MDTFLAPVEKPKGLMMKLAYFFTRRQFGKVLTPLKVHSARLPIGFGMFYAKIGKLDKELELPPEMVMLIRERVAQLNICLFALTLAGPSRSGSRWIKPNSMLWSSTAQAPSLAR